MTTAFGFGAPPTEDQFRQGTREGPAGLYRAPPEVLAALRAQYDQYGPRGPGQETEAGWNYSGLFTDHNGTQYTWNQRPNSPSSAWDDGDIGAWLGGRWNDIYDTGGNWQGRDLAESSWVGLRDSIGKLALGAVGMYYGAGALAGGGEAASMALPASEVGAATVTPELMATMPAVGGGTAAGGAAAGGAAAGASSPWWSSLGSAFGGGGGGAAAGGSGMWGELLNTVVGAGLNYAMRPDSPDYGALTQQQGQNNLAAALLNTSLSRPNITSPYGSQTWEMVADPNSPGGYRSSTNISLSPQQQAIYDQQVGMQLGQGQAAQNLLGQYTANAGTLFNLGSFGPQARSGRTDRLYEPDGGIHFAQVRQNLGQGPSFQGYGGGPSYGGVGSNNLGAFELGTQNGPQMGRVSGQGPAARDLYGQQGYEGSRTSVEDAYRRRLERLRGDQMDQDMVGLETKLKNMGLAEGTEAYDREMRNLRQSQMTERSDWADRAILAGGQEQSRLAGIDLAADAQRFGQQQQGFNNEISAFGFNNNASQQEFANYMTGLAQRNQARQGSTADDIARAGFGNTWARQGMEDQRTAVDQANNTAQRGFENQRLSAEHNNRAYGDEWGRYIQALTTDQALRSGRAAEDNSLRSQAIQEALLARRLPLEEFNSIRTGVNPTMPQFSMGGAGQVAPVNPMVGAQAGYQADMANYNANTALLQQILNSFAQARGGGGGGAFSLGQPGGYTPEDLSYFYG